MVLNLTLYENMHFFVDRVSTRVFNKGNNYQGNRACPGPCELVANNHIKFISLKKLGGSRVYITGGPLAIAPQIIKTAMH